MSAKITGLRRKCSSVFFGGSFYGLPYLNRLRKSVYRRTCRLGRVSVIGNHVQFASPHVIIGRLSVGDHVDLCDEVYIDCTGNVTIEENVTLSRRTTLYSHSHDFAKLAARSGGDVIPGDVTIRRGAWLGDNVIVLPNVTIGEFAVVGAGSVVTKDVPAHTVVAGNPAKFIREVEPKT